MQELERQYRFADIEVSRSNQEDHIVGCFRYESERKKSSPSLLMFVDIASTLYVYEQLLDTINAAAEQARHQLSAVDTDPMARFEKLVQRLNQAIERFVTQEPNAVTWGRVNLYVMELSERQLCLSGIGRLTSIFLQKQPDQRYRIFDLFSSLEQPDAVNPQKPFAALICGDLEPGDILFAGSRNFERLRDELRIVERLQTLPAVSAALEIRQDLEHGEVPDDFAGMVIAQVALPRHAPALTGQPAEPKTEHSTESVKKIYRAERATDDALAPALAALPRRLQDGWIERLQAVFDRLLHGLTRFWPQRRANDPMSATSLRGMNAGYQSAFTTKRKLTIGIYGGLLAMALIGWFWYRGARQQAAEQAVWNAAYDQIIERAHRAEADLVYGNESQAQQLVTEGERMLQTLDQHDVERRAASGKLELQFAALHQRLRHELRNDHPLVIQVIPENAPPNNPLTALAVFHGQIYAGTAQGQVFAVDEANRNVSPVPIAERPSPVQAITNDAQRLLILQANATMLTLDAAALHIMRVPFTPGAASSTAAVRLYTGKLYALDPAKGMIWKYQTKGTGFGMAQAWLKQANPELQTANDLAIDSNVYLSFANGQVVRYLSGKQTAWGLRAIDPPLVSLSSIWTDLNADRLIACDATSPRILVFKKDGGLVGQIVSSALQHPARAIADLSSKKIFVTDGGRIIEFDLP